MPSAVRLTKDATNGREQTFHLQMLARYGMLESPRNWLSVWLGSREQVSNQSSPLRHYRSVRKCHSSLNTIM
ncbi:hypothetical protein E2C01_070686 [Portunus trituberculatus]|uniref:Uncharacterized protein n=1 Tax=Portunus trituberculatus TaxID=210409 RepID=A0A5B7I5X9_PORTR|nr:hypothetical protein [Portunus trituberculatus]